MVMAVYAAINVPVTRILGSPLTLPMLRAARGPLSDSIVYYFTAVNLGAILLVLAAGAIFPLLLSRVKIRFVTPLVIVRAFAVPLWLLTRESRAPEESETTFEVAPSPAALMLCASEDSVSPPAASAMFTGLPLPT